jgi:2'-5' RNA ligase
MHLTVKFLGEIDDRIVPDIAALLGEIAVAASAFDFIIEGLGAFADRRERIRVVFAGIEDIDNRLNVLASDLDGAMSKVGLPAEARPFHPHLTMARCRQPVRLPEVSEFISKNAARRIGEQHVDRLVLYESTLGKDGPVYRTVSTHRLG